MSDPIAPAPSISPFNATIREWVVGRTAAQRHAADTASTILVAITTAEPVLTDVLEKGIVGRDRRGALGSAIIDGSAQGISEGLNFALKYALSGTPSGIRPLADACKTDPTYDSYCGTNNVKLGDPSGHSQLAGTAFGLNIAHAIFDKTYRTATGRLSAKSALELSASGLAMVTTEWLRMRADKHTFEQTMTGGSIGVGVGLAVPFVAQLAGVGYDHWNTTAPSQRVLVPFVSPSNGGAVVGLSGTF